MGFWNDILGSLLTGPKIPTRPPKGGTAESPMHFSTSHFSTSQISINGMNIQVKGSRLYVNGQEYIPVGTSGETPLVEETVLEDLEGGSKRATLSQDTVIESVKGDLYVQVMGGQVHLEVKGDVGGRVDSAGSVTVHQGVGGHVGAGGSVTVNGNVAKYARAGGSITAQNIGGNADARGSVNAVSIRGDVDAGGSVNYSGKG